MYQVHSHDPWTPLDETLRALDDAVRLGKVDYVGLSNFTGWQVQKTVDVAVANHLSRPITLQPQYNLLVREIEWEIVPMCQAEGLGLLPWSPLGGGWLTGKYRRDQRPSGATRLVKTRSGVSRPTVGEASSNGPGTCFGRGRRGCGPRLLHGPGGSGVAT